MPCCVFVSRDTANSVIVVDVRVVKTILLVVVPASLLGVYHELRRS